MPASARARLFALPLEPRDVPVAQLQIVNASPALPTADVFIDTVRIDDIQYQQSAAFVDVNENVAFRIAAVPGTATNANNPVASTTVTLPANARAIAAIVGTPGAAGAAAAKIAVAANARTAATNRNNVDLLILNGSSDAGPVDVKVRGVGPVVNDLPAGTFAPDYVSVPAGRYVFDVTAQNGVTPLGSFIADLTGAGGRSFVLATTGAVAPTAGAAGFDLLTVDAGGTGTLLPETSGFAESSFAVGGPGAATLFNPDGSKAFSVTPFGNAIVARVAAADVTGDGAADLIAGAGPGGTSQVLVYDGRTQAIVRNFTAFEQAFTGGVFVAATDLNGDGAADIVVTPDVTGGPRVQIRSGASGKELTGDFFGIDDPNFRGGARASFADLNADAIPDLIVAAGFGGGPRVAAYNGASLLPGGQPGKLFGDFFVFEERLRNGAFVAGGDLNNDGFDDLIAGAGPGGAPRVYALSGKALTTQNGTQAPLANFYAGPEANRDGVRVAAKDLDGDYQADVVAGLGSGGAAQVRTFLGRNVTAANASITPGAALELNPLTTVGSGGVVFVG